MRELNNSLDQQFHSSVIPRGHPIGGTRSRNRSSRPQSFLSTGEFISVSYCPQDHGQSVVHSAVIEKTSDYDTALEATESMFKRHFPAGNANTYRWLSVRVQTPSGVTWAEFSPDAFPNMVLDGGIELRLCEETNVKLDVSVLPMGHMLETAELQIHLGFKVITIGQMSVGKSMMIQYFTRKETQRQSTLPATIGAESEVTNRFVTSEGELIKATLWDTAGQEEYQSLTRSLYRRTNGVFLVYSVASAKSFQACSKWLQEIRRNVDDETPIMLVGNQIDRRAERRVRTSEARLFALQNNLLFAEISALYGTNVDYAFRRLVHEIYKGLKNTNQLSSFRKTKPAAIPPPKPSKSGCC